MRRPIITTLLIILLCYSTVSSAFAVICHGFDGHITVEPVMHSHCECPDSLSAGETVSLNSSDGHNHCTDSNMTLHAIVSPKKDIRISITKAFMLKPVSKQDLMPISSALKSGFMQPLDFRFHAPLKTIILLA